LPQIEQNPIHISCVYEKKFQKPLYDFDADESIHKFVSPISPFANPQYVPADLIKLEESDFVVIE
jgi:hypothetical protein